MPTPIWSFRSPVGEDEDLNGNDGYSHKRDALSNPSRVKLQKIKLNHNFQVDMSGLVGIGPAQKYDGNQEVVNVVLMSFDSLRRRLCQLVDANELNMCMFKRTDLKAENGISQRNQQMLSQILANASEPTFHLRHALSTTGSDSVRRTHKCCVYIAGSSKYCTRLNSIQAYPRHSLSRAALLTSGSPIFFLDAFTVLIVFYSSTADAITNPAHENSSIKTRVRTEGGIRQLVHLRGFADTKVQRAAAGSMCRPKGR
ncbi:unnamed protein product [Vicia faba]|uniref:Uncharacterized protein n=1 Tax=Vicia faba TaxID=3906 RepID=A0AAV0YYE3_VICFA|nr:unnamed protein product [Vicia faba]